MAHAFTVIVDYKLYAWATWMATGANAVNTSPCVRKIEATEPSTSQRIGEDAYSVFCKDVSFYEPESRGSFSWLGFANIT